VKPEGISEKNEEYPKDKIDEFVTNGKHKNNRDLYRGISDFKGDYQPRSNLVMDENGDLFLQIPTTF
jgi:hypothetical protein